MEFTSRRSPVLCTHGCAASSQPLASEIGLRVLRAGGNAADACVAMAAALNVAEPCMTGIGGDAFCLFFDAKSKSVRGLNGSGRCPAALDLAAVRAAGQTAAALDAASVHCITTPGAAAAWVDTIERFGRLPLADVLAPAIALAEDGVPVNVVSAACWQAQEEQLTRWAHNPGVAQFLPNGRAPRAGEVLAMPELAATFRALAAKGKPGFYGGRVARAIAEAVAANGGRLSEADLAAHVSTFDDPLCVEFEGVRVWELPPNGQGIVALLALQTLRARLPELRRAAHNSAEYLHLVAEALRLAFADAAAGAVADPTVDGGAASTLLNDAYARARAALITPGTAMPTAVAGDAALALHGSDTVYLCAVDADGNACSFINSNYMGFGSGLVPAGCGFTLHNRGANFSLVDGHPNALGPGKRPFHTIIPGMLTAAADGGGDELVAAFGVMGGFMQPQGHVQLLLNLLLHGMDPQAALDAPRLCLTARGGLQSDEAARAADADGGGVVVALEDGIAPEVAAALRGYGHAVEASVSGAARALFGRGQAIHVRRAPAFSPAVGKRARGDGEKRRVLWAGSDGRGDGMAVGY